jgi:lipoic acid synthetase
MVGLGEAPEEVEGALHDLCAAGVEVVTIGQYLQPSRGHLPVAAYIRPERFEAYRAYGLSIGFKMVLSGPLVRSSYLAEAVWAQAFS